MTPVSDTVVGSTKVVILAGHENVLRGSRAEFRHFGISPVVRTEIVTALAEVIHDPAAVLVVSSDLPCLELRDVLDLAVAACGTAVLLGLAADTTAAALELALVAGVRSSVDLPLTGERIANALQSLPVAPTRTSPVVVGELTVDDERHTVTWSGRSVNLTRREFAIVRELADTHPGLVTLDQLAAAYDGSARDPHAAVRVAINHVRRRFESVAGLHGASCIETVRGVGYRLSA